jgi:tetratricopeptide (TPR) repeat protein
LVRSSGGVGPRVRWRSGRWGAALATGTLIAVALVVPAALAQPPGIVTDGPERSTPSLSDSLRPLVNLALVTSSPDNFDRALAFVSAARSRAPGDAVLAHYAGFLLYRKASVLVSAKPGDKAAKRLLEEAARALEASESLGWAETPALQSSVVGQLIGFSGPLGAVRMAPRAGRLLDEAIARAPENPRVLMLRGVSFLFRPRLFGGGADKAEHDLRRAIARFAGDAPAPPAPWWGRAEAHGWLGEALARQGKVAEARAEFARALALEPGNVWVRDALLPALDRKR